MKRVTCFESRKRCVPTTSASITSTLTHRPSPLVGFGISAISVGAPPSPGVRLKPAGAGSLLASALAIAGPGEAAEGAATALPETSAAVEVAAVEVAGAEAVGAGMAGAEAVGAEAAGAEAAGAEAAGPEAVIACSSVEGAVEGAVKGASFPIGNSLAASVFSGKSLTRSRCPAPYRRSPAVPVARKASAASASKSRDRTCRNQNQSETSRTNQSASKSRGRT